MSKHARLLVCDLDGTLIGDDAALAELLGLLEEPGAPALAFATGRQRESACELLAAADVRAGAYLIAGVGTELHRRGGDAWERMDWPPQLDAWDPQRVRAALDALDVVPQSVRSPYKVSYVAHAAAIPAVKDALAREAIVATLVHSHGDLLDVLPPGIDKGSAVRHLAERTGTPLRAVMTCGDTENDLAMLALPGPSVIVGNAGPELRAAAPRLRNVYIARAHAAAGVREGLERYGWLTARGWSLLD